MACGKHGDVGLLLQALFLLLNNRHHVGGGIAPAATPQTVAERLEARFPFFFL